MKIDTEDQRDLLLHALTHVTVTWSLQQSTEAEDMIQTVKNTRDAVASASFDEPLEPTKKTRQRSS